MGLAGRKTKQRIPADPRNLSWADGKLDSSLFQVSHLDSCQIQDASRFGQAYLSKFGWDASQGLGASGEGMTTHLKASQKLDLLGIGAAHQKDPHGIAWKQNRDFETLLMRLNSRKEEGGGVDGGDCDVAKIEGFVSATGKEKDEVEVDHGEADLPKTKTKKKKRVAVCENDENEESKKKKKRKRDLVQEGSEDKKPGKEEKISDDPSVGAKKSCHQPTSPFEPGTQASLKPFGRRMA